MGTIKAIIKTIYVRGQKVRSALFNTATKPIFRSESARYVLFLQMSKEMWDFDADGTGEIMFSKVINGFLPELFNRWQQLKARHLVTIVLFTRLEYKRGLATSFVYPDMDDRDPSMQNTAGNTPCKDFYRVVVSDMGSGEWAFILAQLKSEFKVFLRDVSIRRPNPGDYVSLGTGLNTAAADVPDYVIAGYPSAATRGNILEAINLASSQFSCDHIDRDLVRTGVSIAVITPGTGLFEVDYTLLATTTDRLIENGVGIDLVCLSRVPLHSVPLFKYRQPRVSVRKPTVLDDQPYQAANKKGISIVASTDSLNSNSSPTTSEASTGSKTNSPSHSLPENWNYAIPHWVDVSFWTLVSDEDRTQAVIAKKPTKIPKNTEHRRKPFVPRVRMYELQMMGVMENTVSVTSLPYLIHSIETPNDQMQGRRKTPASKARKASSSIKLQSTHGRRDGRRIAGASQVSGSTPSTDDESVRTTKSRLHWMDDYDEMVFRHPKERVVAAHMRSSKRPAGKYRYQDLSPSLLGTSPRDGKSSSESKHGLAVKDYPDRNIKERHLGNASNSKRGSITSSTASSPRMTHPAPARLSRQISYGLRGFGAAPPKAVASIEVSSEHAESASLLSRGLRSRNSTMGKDRPSSTQTGTKRVPRQSSASSEDPSLKDPEAPMSLDVEVQKSSRPIPIRKPTSIRIKRGPGRDSVHNAIGMVDEEYTSKGHEILQTSSSPDPTESLGHPKQSVGVEQISPSNALASWLTILNPSNPHQMDITLTGRLGRWQHIFPRPLSAARMKWKSLCSPAAIPLTTEEFPSEDQLAKDYEESSYRISLAEDDRKTELIQRRKSLVREMMAFRFSHGFQVVVGSRIAQTMQQPSLETFDVFNEDYTCGVGATVVMSRVSMIHQMSCVGADEIEIRCLSRRAGTERGSSNAVHTAVMYKPAMRTMLSTEYVPQDVSLSSQRQRLDWELIDSFLNGHEKQQAEQYPDNLRPWRARFVLIPIDPPTSARRSLLPLNEDDEEEIRLEGIRKLTQVWQRFRYISAEERRFQAPSRKSKDSNPLDIMYQTRNPSAIVAAELGNLGENDSTGGPVQLLAETELYQRLNLNLASLSQTVQGEKGIRMMDRRWHWRLHYNCFIGSELTTWLLQNFRDIETRDEAIELGNDLMKSGLFQHVEQRHNFRDGNFFYQIASDYRTPRPESKSNWFGSRRTDKSVPPTPGAECMSRESTKGPGSRSSSNDSGFTDQGTATPTVNKKRLGVALSKSLLYDVDHRKRSYRPELIRLHYDRLHNPDNCYHIRIEWMNVTSKLIEDAIVSWATSVDRFGLRLVEVPIGEASAISEMHPFRAPYLVKLAQHPPGEQPKNYFDATSFTPSARTDTHFYQKAVLKKLNFVLDFEAANAFPSNVDVTYSWGKPDYRYPQYIHRSGVLLVQITDEGDFLLLANRLYNNRSASFVEAVKPDLTDAQDRNKSVPTRTGNHRGSPRSSPFSSPLVRATLDVPHPSPGPSTYTTPRSSSPSTPYATAEHIKAEFESFCRDPVALAAFYEEALSKSLSPGMNTPLLDSSIPALGLPPSLTLKELPSAPSTGGPRAKVAGNGNGSPRTQGADVGGGV